MALSHRTRGLSALTLLLAIFPLSGSVCGGDDEASGTCGNGRCGDRGETLRNCPQDCGSLCGNRICDTLIENKDSCPGDCGCGNGVCEIGETSLTCRQDCHWFQRCGDGSCAYYNGETAENCPEDCRATCGNTICEPLDGDSGCGEDCYCAGTLCEGDGRCECERGETVANSPDCTYESCVYLGCGDGRCDVLGLESSVNCPADCYCGNGNCDKPSNALGINRDAAETPQNCPVDCPCGNGVCETLSPIRETVFNCAADCSCENGVCEAGEESGCPADCPCGDGYCNVNEYDTACLDCTLGTCRGPGCPVPDAGVLDASPGETGVDASIEDANDAGACGELDQPCCVSGTPCASGLRCGGSVQAICEIDPNVDAGTPADAGSSGNLVLSCHCVGAPITALIIECVPITCVNNVPDTSECASRCANGFDGAYCGIDPVTCP